MILESNNKGWGFWGTIAHLDDPRTAWDAAFTEIKAATKIDDEGIRAFLDSREGRHFADDTINELATGLSIENAVKTAVVRWMGWKIDQKTSREYGIPTGLPYLTGWVAHHDIHSQA
jgi:hypothetical protein